MLLSPLLSPAPPPRTGSSQRGGGLTIAGANPSWQQLQKLVCSGNASRSIYSKIEIPQEWQMLLYELSNNLIFSSKRSDEKLSSDAYHKKSTLFFFNV